MRKNEIKMSLIYDYLFILKSELLCAGRKDINLNGQMSLNLSELTEELKRKYLVLLEKLKLDNISFAVLNREMESAKSENFSHLLTNDILQKNHEKLIEISENLTKKLQILKLRI